SSGRPCTRRWPCKDGCPRQTRAVPASEGLLRHTDRARAGLMSLATSIAIYFIIWWVVLFAVLPWGVRSQHEGGEIAPGSDPGAPAIPRLKRKLDWTTIIAALVFGLWHVVYTYRLITLDDLAALLGITPP